MPHFQQALEINRTVAGLAAVCEQSQSQTHFALVDRGGFIHFAQPGFLTLLRQEWSELDDYLLPRVIMAALREGNGKAFVGHRIKCAQQPAGDLILLRVGPSTRLDSLSARQHEVAALYAVGHSYKEIAQRLRVAPATVRNHLAAIFRLLGITTKAELIALAEGTQS